MLRKAIKHSAELCLLLVTVNTHLMNIVCKWQFVLAVHSLHFFHSLTNQISSSHWQLTVSLHVQSSPAVQPCCTFIMICNIKCLTFNPTIQLARNSLLLYTFVCNNTCTSLCASFSSSDELGNKEDFTPLLHVKRPKTAAEIHQHCRWA
jgi:hypothetical protein